MTSYRCHVHGRCSVPVKVFRRRNGDISIDEAQVILTSYWLMCRCNQSLTNNQKKKLVAFHRSNELSGSIVIGDRFHRTGAYTTWHQADNAAVGRKTRRRRKTTMWSVHSSNENYYPHWPFPWPSLDRTPWCSSEKSDRGKVREPGGGRITRRREEVWLCHKRHFVTTKEKT